MNRCPACDQRFRGDHHLVPAHDAYVHVRCHSHELAQLKQQLLRDPKSVNPKSIICYIPGETQQ